MQLSTLNLGIFLAYWVDYGFTQSYDASFAWRIPCILQCIFLFPMLVLLFLVPESPRWLASHSRADESLAVLKRLHTYHMPPNAITSLHTDIVHTCEYEASLGAGKWSDLLHNDSIRKSAPKISLIVSPLKPIPPRALLKLTCTLSRITTPLPHSLRHPILPTTRRHKRPNLLLQHPLLDLPRLLRPPLRPNVRLSPNLVFRRFIHPLVPNRPHRSSSIAIEHD